MVNMQVAIAISLASFMVGALSTGVLWFIHSRALRAKSVGYPNFSLDSINSSGIGIGIARILRDDLATCKKLIQEQLRIACEGTELVGLSPGTNNHTISNGAPIGALH